VRERETKEGERERDERGERERERVVYSPQLRAASPHLDKKIFKMDVQGSLTIFSLSTQRVSITG